MPAEFYKFDFDAMGGGCEIQLFADTAEEGHTAAEAAIAEVKRIEQKFSRYRSESVITAINAAAGRSALNVDGETAALLDYAAACFRQSRGHFDITSGVLRKVWNFKRGIIPDREAICSLLPLIGWARVTWSNPKIYLPFEGMELDFGGIGKEYAVDRAAELLLKAGISNALVNLSGDLRACGPQADGSPWRIGITDPRSPNKVLDAVDLYSGAAATSGDYERRIEINGKRYSHLLNPKTGWPVSGLQSVTVFAPSCIVAGSITTSAMLAGKDGEEYLKELDVPYLLVTGSGKVHYTPLLRPLLHSVNRRLSASEPAAKDQESSQLCI